VNDGGRSALMLLEAGASLDSVARDDLCAFASKSTAAILVLIGHGVVVRDIFASDGRTPLHFAAASVFDRDANLYRMLVNVCGIDLEARCHDGRSSVHVAVEHGNVWALRWLIGAGANVNCVTNDGQRPLHMITRYESTVQLLAACADPIAANNAGLTPLQVAKMSNKWMEVAILSVAALVAVGADLDAADNSGQTARQALKARTDLAKARLDFVRYRALEVCIGLQSRELDALQLCEILQFACGRFAPLIPFHTWWKIATTVKHFRN
jgi:ankyrin repeat protein